MKASAPVGNPKSSLSAKAFHALNMLLEKILCFAIVPQVRVILLKLLGAQIGRNVRLHEIRFFNVQSGFRNLIVEDNVHIGPGTRIDLYRTVTVKKDTVISPECLLLTHTDMGEFHSSLLSRIYPSTASDLVIGESCYLGSRAVVLPGSSLGQATLVAAGSVVCNSVDGSAMIAGVPAREVKQLEF